MSFIIATLISIIVVSAWVFLYTEFVIIPRINEALADAEEDMNTAMEAKFEGATVTKTDNFNISTLNVVVETDDLGAFVSGLEDALRKFVKTKDGK
jgi:hypothetical protein